MTRRIVIETSNQQKETLDLFLEQQGTSLSDWFADRVAETTASYEKSQDPSQTPLCERIDLAEPAKVFDALRGVDWAFTNEDTGYLSHSLHPYPAKFIPQIPRNLILRLSTPGEVVWDPFGGSGTTALEALLLQRGAISSDVNPVAEVIGRAKTAGLPIEAERIVSKQVQRLNLLCREPLAISEMLLRHRAEIESLIPPIPNIKKWFHENAIRELAYIRWHISRTSNDVVATLARAAFSKIILRSSYQDNETRYASKPREVAVGFVLRMFAAELESARIRVRATSQALRGRQGTFTTADIREDGVVAPHSVDLVVTSPPYPNATDYHLYHRFRLYWLGHSPQDLGKREIGSHLRHQKESTGISDYVSEMRDALKLIHRGLRPSRYAVLVVGDGVFDGATHSTAELLSDAGREVGFEIVGTINRPLHATKRSFIGVARRLRTEQLLVLRRSPTSDRIQLEPPPYRLWKYEETLRTLEIETLTGSPPSGKPAGSLSVPGTEFITNTLRRLTFTHSFHSKSHAPENTWQATLENGDAASDSCRKDPKYATHGIHAYKGKFYPQLAKSLLNIGGLGPGMRVLDPFCGSGTVLLEGKLNGVTTFGSDLNPLAVMIARAKTEIIAAHPTLVARMLRDAIAEVAEAEPSDDIESAFRPELLVELRSWFPASVLRQLASLRILIAEVPDTSVRSLLEICLSNIVRDVSHQDPRDLRIRRRKAPLKSAPVFELFAQQVSTQRLRLEHFAQRAGRAPSRFAETRVVLADCRTESAYEELGLCHKPVDGVVTSPPYATALPYIDTDRLSLLLLLGMQSRERSAVEYALTGSREISTLERRAIESRIDVGDFGGIASPTAIRIIKKVLTLNRQKVAGFRRTNQASLLFRYYDDMSRVLGHLHRNVRTGGPLFFVIGDNMTTAGGEEIIVRSAQMLRETGEALGWRHRKSIPITVTQDARPHIRNGITENDVVWFER